MKLFVYFLLSLSLGLVALAKEKKPVKVFILAGQSNMDWRVKQSADPQEEIANAKHPLIRHIKIPHRPAAQPENDVPSDGWKVC